MNCLPPLSLFFSLSLRGSPDLVGLVGQLGVNSFCFYIYNCTEIKAVLENNTEVFFKSVHEASIRTTSPKRLSGKTRACGSYWGR